MARRGSRPGRRESAIRQVAEALDRAEDRQSARIPSCWTCRAAIGNAWSAIAEQLGIEPQTLFTSMQQFINSAATQAWSDMAGKLDYEVFDQAVGAFDWYCIEELRKGAPPERASRRSNSASRRRPHRPAALARAAPKPTDQQIRRTAIAPRRPGQAIRPRLAALAEIQGRPGQGDG